jgi:hypothetical protein
MDQPAGLDHRVQALPTWLPGPKLGPGDPLLDRPPRYYTVHRHCSSVQDEHPTRAVRWFTTNPNFAVSAMTRTMIAGHIPALRIDYIASSSAPQCPGAPEPGADYFAFFGGPQPDATDLAPGHTPGIKDGFGTGISEPVRLYFARIGSPSHSHLFVVGLDTPGRNDLAGLQTDAAKMLAHLHLPAALPRTGKRCNCLNASDSGPGDPPGSIHREA